MYTSIHEAVSVRNFTIHIIIYLKIETSVPVLGFLMSINTGTNSHRIVAVSKNCVQPSQESSNNTGIKTFMGAECDISLCSDASIDQLPLSVHSIAGLGI